MGFIYRERLPSKAVTGRCSVLNVFLKISQNSKTPVPDTGCFL